MIVSGISAICVNNNYPKRPLNVSEYCLNNIQKQNAKDVSFTGISPVSIDKLFSKFYDPLKKIPEYSVEEYKTLSNRELSVLRKRYKHLTESLRGGFYKNVEYVHDKSVQMIKDGLDSKYGEGQYRVVIVGRSMSSIGKVLGYKIGEENVINIPMSKCQRYMNPGYIDLKEKDGEIEYFKTFLKTKGLSKENFDKSDKKLILMDYCCTGDSLKGVTTLFKSIYEDSEKIIPENPINFISDKKLQSSLSRIFLSCIFKKFSFVNRAVYLSDIQKSVVDTSKSDYESRLMWFKLLDNHMTQKKTNTGGIKTDNFSVLSLKA